MSWGESGICGGEITGVVSVVGADSRSIGKVICKVAIEVVGEVVGEVAIEVVGEVVGEFVDELDDSLYFLTILLFKMAILLWTVSNVFLRLNPLFCIRLLAATLPSIMWLKLPYLAWT